MGDEGPRRIYLISRDHDGHWHSSSIPDTVSKSKKKGDEIEERAPRTSICYDDRRDWYGDESIERRARTTSIWSGGWDSSITPFALFTYVALQGKDSICVVTADSMLVNNSINLHWMASVINCIKADYVFGYDQRERGLYLGMPQEDEDLMPFATVNVVMNTNVESGDEASSVGLNEKKAIALLMKKMEKGLVLSYEETIQATLSALQHLLKRQFVSGTVKVCVEKKGTGKAQQLTSKEINQYLKVINKPRKASRTGQSPS